MGVLSYKEVAEVLEKMYNASFGGKDGGRFILAKKHLAKVSGRHRILGETLASISEATLELPTPLLVLDLDDDIAVIKASTAERWRKVPKKVIRLFNENSEIDKEEDEDDDDESGDLGVAANSTLPQTETNMTP